MVGKALGDGFVVWADVLERVCDSQMQLGCLSGRNDPDDRVTNQIVCEAIGERVSRRPLQQAERFQWLQPVEAGLNVEVGGLGKHVEADVPTDERCGVQKILATVVEVGQPVLHDITNRGWHRHVRYGVAVEHTAVGKESGQLPYEERVAARAGMDAPGDIGIQIPAGFAADEFGHLGQVERTKPDASVARHPARSGEHPRQLCAGSGRTVTQGTDDDAATWEASSQVSEQVQ